MKLKIKQGNTELFDIEVETDATIDSIQKLISHRIGVSTDHFRLSYYDTNNKV
jgi:hypothetical protein